MKTYSGKIKIDCLKGNKQCPQGVAGESVLVICADCHLGGVTITDLEGDVLFTFPPFPGPPEIKKPKKKKTK